MEKTTFLGNISSDILRGAFAGGLEIFTTDKGALDAICYEEELISIMKKLAIYSPSVIKDFLVSLNPSKERMEFLEKELGNKLSSLLSNFYLGRFKDFKECNFSVNKYANFLKETHVYETEALCKEVALTATRRLMKVMLITYFQEKKEAGLTPEFYSVFKIPTGIKDLPNFHSLELFNIRTVENERYNKDVGLFKTIFDSLISYGESLNLYEAEDFVVEMKTKILNLKNYVLSCQYSSKIKQFVSYCSENTPEIKLSDDEETKKQFFFNNTDNYTFLTDGKKLSKESLQDLKKGYESIDNANKYDNGVKNYIYSLNQSLLNHMKGMRSKMEENEIIDYESFKEKMEENEYNRISFIMNELEKIYSINIFA